MHQMLLKKLNYNCAELYFKQLHVSYNVRKSDVCYMHCTYAQNWPACSMMIFSGEMSCYKQSIYMYSCTVINTCKFFMLCKEECIGYDRYSIRSAAENGECMKKISPSIFPSPPPYSATRQTV